LGDQFFKVGFVVISDGSGLNLQGRYLFFAQW
jgi:hypothetical protein